jgi:ferredoxin
MRQYLIDKNSFYEFLQLLQNEFEVYALKEASTPYLKGEVYFQERLYNFFRLKEITPKQIVYAGYRANLTIKHFFTPLKQRVSGGITHQKPIALVGAKACDLASLELQDFVFLKGQCEDPFYRQARQANLIISADCTEVKSVCYCLHLKINPYPEKNFDLNLSEIGEKMIVSVGSDKGQRVIEENRGLFSEASRLQIDEAKEIRHRTVAKLRKNLSNLNLPPSEKWPSLVREKRESKLWDEEAVPCVECAACTQVCPTCHCFILGDQKSAFGYERFKIWDSCQYNGFARVAGLATPRPRRFQRLRNRYVKKFDYFPQLANLIACTGCGRCIEVCPGKIDMRRIFKNLDQEKPKA